LAALRFVQDDVRYMGMEIGAHSYQPEDPSVVFTRRFGDCKGKTFLLCAMLNELGFEASPALVHSRGSLERHQPSPLAFNHVIVNLKYNGREWWLDPTATYRRGPLSARTSLDYEHALVARAGTSELSRLEPRSRKGTKTVVRQVLTLKGTNEPAEMRITTTYEGRDAESYRAMLATITREDITKWRLADHAQIFPLIESKGPVEVTDRDTQLQIVEQYRVPEPWNRDGWRWTCAFDARSLSEIIDVPLPTPRTVPLGIFQHPCHRVHVTTVNLPTRMSYKDESEYIGGPADELRFKRLSTGDTLTLEYDYSTKADSVPPARLTEHIKARKRMQHVLGMTLYWTPAIESFSRRPLRVGKAWYVAGGFMVLMIALYVKFSHHDEEI
jgi:hypothetical protein